jgi:CRP-like cAMP-binding protein
MLGIASPYVRRYGADDPRFLRFLVEQLREKLYKTNTLQISNVLPAINRLAIYILSQPTNDDGNVILPNKEDFASLMGTTTRHLNRLLKELVERQFITTGYPMIKVLNSQALQNIKY